METQKILSSFLQNSFNAKRILLFNALAYTSLFICIFIIFMFTYKLFNSAYVNTDPTFEQKSDAEKSDIIQDRFLTILTTMTNYAFVLIPFVILSIVFFGLANGYSIHQCINANKQDKIITFMIEQYNKKTFNPV